MRAQLRTRSRRRAISRSDSNVHRGPSGELHQAPTAKIGLLANASLRVEPYTTPYQIMSHP